MHPQRGYTPRLGEHGARIAPRHHQGLQQPQGRRSTSQRLHLREGHLPVQLNPIDPKGIREGSYGFRVPLIGNKHPRHARARRNHRRRLILGEIFSGFWEAQGKAEGRGPGLRISFASARSWTPAT